MNEARCTCGLLADLCQCYRAGRIEVAQELDRYKKALEVAKSYIRDHCDWQVGADAFEDIHSLVAGDK